MKNKKPILGLAALLTSIFIFSLIDCTEPSQTYINPNTASTTITIENDNGWGKSSIDLNEFEYKGHTYISCYVRDGIALTHAGHCKCNSK